MREIEFRGIDAIGDWQYGSYYVGVMYPTSFIGHYINDTQIIPVTVGQYTGLKDKNGVKIFEGDVCRFNTKNGQKKHEQKVIVFWGIDAQFRIENSNGSAFYMSDSLHLWISYDFEVIGNIHQNPELLNK